MKVPDGRIKLELIPLQIRMFSSLLMVETLISLGGTGLLQAIAPLFDSETEELDAALGGVFSFLSMKEVSADYMCWN